MTIERFRTLMVMFVLFCTAATFYGLGYNHARIKFQYAEPVLEKRLSKWSEPKITSSQWDGTTVWQTRTNLDNGEVELRGQTASPKGGYYAKP